MILGNSILVSKLGPPQNSPIFEQFLHPFLLPVTASLDSFPLQAYVVGGVLMLPVFLIFYLLGGFKLMVNLSSFTYPAYKSLQAIPVTSADEDKQWLTYWVRWQSVPMLKVHTLHDFHALSTRCSTAHSTFWRDPSQPASRTTTW